MKRSVISLIIIGLHLIILTVALRIPVAADSLQQTIPPADVTATPSTPMQISVQQQVPLALTIQRSIASTETLTSTTTLTETIAVTVDLSFDITLTDTVTATIPSTVRITFADAQTTTVPVSLTVALTPTASIVITPLAVIAETAGVTETESLTATASLTEGVALTPTLGLTTTVPPQIFSPTVVSTVAITANLRSGPDTTFDIQNTIAVGQSVLVVAQNADGTWYLLNNGLWLAAFLVENPPTTLPIATEELVTTLREQNPITPTVPLLPSTEITSTTPITGDAETGDAETGGAETEGPGLPILVPTPTPAVPSAESTEVITPTAESEEAAPADETGSEAPTVTVDANLREGPGTTFPIIGGTLTGQALTIVARNEDGSWFLLDNGGWLAAFLIANAPDPATVPLFEESTAQADAATPTTPLTPTVALTPTFGVQENLYVIRVDGITDRYDFALTQVENLVATAQEDPAQLENQEWIIQMTTMITLLRSASEELQSLAAPTFFAGAQTQLTQAANAYVVVADLLATAVEQLESDRLADASAQIEVGNQLLGAALSELERLTP